MKKSLVICGVAALALASCTQNEVLDVNESRAIGFNAFVNNNTRAVTEVKTLTDYYVFANFGTSDFSGVAYNNESKNQTYYWAETGNKYRFGAYANGDAGKLTTTTQVSFAPATGTNGTLTFTGYTPDGKDLVAAVANEYTVTGSEDASTKVQLSFKHLLSQVKFTFKTTDADTYTIAISELKINGAVSKATGTYDGAVNWNTSANTETSGYSYDDIADIADAAANYQGSSVETVIPQGNTNTLNVTFKATVSGGGMETKEATFTANLDYEATNIESGEVGTDNTWTAGYIYNYIATINADQIDPNIENKKINFEVQVIENWKPANDTDKGELSKQP